MPVQPDPPPPPPPPLLRPYYVSLIITMRKTVYFESSIVSHCAFRVILRSRLPRISLSKWRLFRPSGESHLFQLKHCHLVSIKYTMPSVWIIYDSDSLPVTRQCTFHAFVISNKNQKIFVAVHSKITFCNRIKEFMHPAKRNIVSISPCYVFVVGL